MPTMKLTCPMSDAEKLEALTSMSQRLTLLKAAREEKTEKLMELNKSIKAHESELDLLNDSINDSTTEREVEVRDEMDYDARIVKTIRLDMVAKDGSYPQEAIVDTRPMTEAERNTTIADLQGRGGEAPETEEERDAMDNQLDVLSDKATTKKHGISGYYSGRLETPAWVIEGPDAKTADEALEKLFAKVRAVLLKEHRAAVAKLAANGAAKADAKNRADSKAGKGGKGKGGKAKGANGTTAGPELSLVSDAGGVAGGYDPADAISNPPEADAGAATDGEANTDAPGTEADA